MTTLKLDASGQCQCARCQARRTPRDPIDDAQIMIMVAAIFGLVIAIGLAIAWAAEDAKPTVVEAPDAD